MNETNSKLIRRRHTRTQPMQTPYAATTGSTWSNKQGTNKGFRLVFSNWTGKLRFQSKNIGLKNGLEQSTWRKE